MTDKPKSQEMDKGRMTAGICIIVILVLIICLQNASENELTLWQTEEDIENTRRALRMQQSELQKELNRTEQLRLAREAFLKDSMAYWIVERDGPVEGNIQRIVNGIGESSKIKLTRITNLSHEKIDNGVKLYHFTIGSDTNMEALAKFIDGVRQTKPKLFWKDCSIRPKRGKDANIVYMKGTLSFLCIEDEKLVKVLNREKKI